MVANRPMTRDFRPQLSRLARIDFDRVRRRPVLLYPEGAMFINDTGKAILELCNGERTAGEIARELEERYKSEVLSDVIEYLEVMELRNLVVDRAAVAP